MFEAAVELWRYKNTSEANKVRVPQPNFRTMLDVLIQKGITCTPRGGLSSHQAPPDYLVNCKKCHAAKCFAHILGSSVHASEALLANAADSTGAVWHKRHQEARKRKISPVASLPRIQEFDSLYRRAFFAQHFSSTSPLEPSMRVGFYDTPLQGSLSVSFRQVHITPSIG